MVLLLILKNTDCYKKDAELAFTTPHLFSVLKSF